MQQRPVSQSLISYVQSLPVASEDGGYDMRGLVSDLLNQVKGNLSSNNIVIPVLQTFAVLLEADALEPLYDDTDGLKRCVLIRVSYCTANIRATSSLRVLLSICTKGIARFKNVQRIATSMRMYVFPPMPSFTLPQITSAS